MSGEFTEESIISLVDELFR